MKILQTPARLYPYIGGVETVVLALSRALARRGHEVSVITADEPAGGPRQIDGVQIRRLRYPLKLANTNITPTLPLYLARERFDVVHTHLPTPWSADWSILIARARGKGAVLTYYNDIVGLGAAGGAARAYNAFGLPLTLRLAHRIVVNSSQMLERPGSPLAAVRHKASLLPNGVDTAQFYPRPELRADGTIGFLAVLDEFHRYKGLDILLKAAQQLVKRGRAIRLSIAGEGLLRSEYQGLADGLGLRDRVEFLGRIPDAGLLDFFNRCELFVLPTTDPRLEGFGVVVLEALACGVPVVVTSAAGVAADVRSLEVGVVVPPNDIGALANALDGLLDNPARSALLAARGRRAAETRFSWTAIAKQFEQLYEQALASH